MIAGIDPGRWKTGFALAALGDRRLLFSAIVPSDKKEILIRAIAGGDWRALKTWRQEGSADEVPQIPPQAVAVGGGTSSREFIAALPFPYEIVKEYGTTLEARKIYWTLHPPRGLARLVPLSLRTPKRAVDDLAAYAIALRAIQLS